MYYLRMWIQSHIQATEAYRVKLGFSKDEAILSRHYNMKNPMGYTTVCISSTRLNFFSELLLCWPPPTDFG